MSGFGVVFPLDDLIYISNYAKLRLFLHLLRAVESGWRVF